MKVIVVVESKFEVDVNTHDAALAQQAVEANWDTIYKHQARWHDGNPPHFGRFIRAEIPK
jgi:hypothetical protein